MGAVRGRGGTGHSKSLQGMYDTRNVPKDCQQDVDQQVGSAPSLKEDTERWEEDC